MRELAERDHPDEDQSDREHDEDGLLALLRGTLGGEHVQLREHGRNLQEAAMGSERTVDLLVTGCGPRRGLERRGIAAQP